MQMQPIIDMQGIVKRYYIGKPNELEILHGIDLQVYPCLLYTSPSPRDRTRSRMPSSA